MEKVKNKLIEFAIQHKTKISERHWDKVISDIEKCDDVLHLLAIARIDFGYESFDEVMSGAKPSGCLFINPASNQKVIIEWVSVKDALPQNRQKVLFGTKNGEVYKAIYLEKLVNQYGDYDQLFLADDGGYYQVALDMVTFWCEVPKLP